MAEIDNVLAQVLAQMQEMDAGTPLHQQEPVVLARAITNLSNDTKIKPVKAPTKDLVVETLSLKKNNHGLG